jgi:hypothetical protein
MTSNHYATIIIGAGRGNPHGRERPRYSYETD